MNRSVALAIAAAFCIQQPARAADLSPAHWPRAERARLEQLELSPSRPAARTVTGRSEMVSATLSPIAVQVGLDALRQGGSAADAAIAVALTQTATDLGAVVSYAGVAQFLYYDARTRRTYSLDAGWATYAGERDPATIPKADLSLLGLQAGTEGAQGRKTLVPGFMAGMEAAHRRFGRLPFADLFQPAIWYARNGLTVTPLLASYFAIEQPKLSRTAEGRAFLGQAGGGLPKAGDRFIQPQLAALLDQVSRRGAAYMYDGRWARDYVQAVRREGGAASLEDLKRYRPVWEQPLSTGFGGAEVTGPGATNAGGCAVLEALNLLDAEHFAERPPYWRDADSFAAETKALRFAALAHWDPRVAAFEAAHGWPSSCASRVQPAYASLVAPQIDALTASPGAGAAGHHSAAVVVVDRWGDVAVLVHSINSLMWGETGMVVDGVPIGSPAAVNQARLLSIRPGAAVPSDMAPVIAFREGRPVLAVAAVGSSLQPETVRLAAGLLAPDADPLTLAAAPPMLMNFAALGSGKPLGGQPALVPAGAYPAPLRAAVQARGMELDDASPAMTAALRGTAAFVRIGAKGLSSAEAPGVIVFAGGR